MRRGRGHDPIRVVEAEEADAILEAVRKRYAEVAKRARVSLGRETRPGRCCGGEDAALPAPGGAGSAGGCGCGGPCAYTPEERASVPRGALAASAGCGNPVALARLHPGEVVLDLGSGGGIDVLLSARRVGPGGFAWGVDMTEEMLALAEENRQRSGLDNVAFLKGRIEAVPLPDSSVDVVISNCVINLSVDKAAVLREAARLLRAGGRLAVYDIVARKPLPGTLRRTLQAWSACVAGALDVATYQRLLQEAGFVDIQIQPASALESACCEDVRELLPLDSAFIQARKPGSPAFSPGELSVQPASQADLPAIQNLLERAGLPLDGVADHLEGFLVARRLLPGRPPAPAISTLVGCAGVERYGTQALLRSVAVTPPLQGAGIGRQLVDAALARARQSGVAEVYLLTTTAEGYFRRFGFERVERRAVAGPVTSSVEFAAACPRSAVIMRRRLATSPPAAHHRTSP